MKEGLLTIYEFNFNRGTIFIFNIVLIIAIVYQDLLSQSWL